MPLLSPQKTPSSKEHETLDSGEHQIPSTSKLSKYFDPEQDKTPKSSISSESGTKESSALSDNTSGNEDNCSEQVAKEGDEQKLNSCNVPSREFKNLRSVYRRKQIKHKSPGHLKNKNEVKLLPKKVLLSSPKVPQSKVVPKKVTAISEDEENVKAEPDVHECEFCFRIFRAWSKFVEHSKSMHKFTPKSPDLVEESNEIGPVSADENISTPEKNIDCTICNSKFKNNHGLIVHSRKHHNKLCCSECVEFFDTQDDLENHILVHELQKLNSPNIPTEIEKILPSPVAEFTSKPQQSKHECYYCCSTYSKRTALIDHHRKIHKKVSCSKCLNAFDSVTQLEQHHSEDHVSSDTSTDDPSVTSNSTSTATQVESFYENLICKSCNTKFKLRSTYFTHIRHFHRKIPCYLCLNMFDNEEIDEHKLSCIDPTLICQYCDHISYDRLLFFHHMKSHSKKGQKIFKSIAFQSETKKVLPRAAITHASPVNIKQTQKHKSSSSSNTTISKELQSIKTCAIQKRSKTTSSESPFCPVCSKTVASWHNVKRHVKDVHSSVKYFECKNCIRIFLDPKLLQVHDEKKHSGVSDNMSDLTRNQGVAFTCRYCGIHFSENQNNLLAHEAKHRQQGDKFMKNASFNSANTTPLLSPEKQNESEVPAVTANHGVTPKKKMTIICNFCTTALDTYSNLLSHLKAVHSTELYFCCAKCDKIFFDTANFKKHSLTAHKHSTSHMACRYCSRSFANESFLMSHEIDCVMKDTEESRQYICPSYTQNSSANSRTAMSPLTPTKSLDAKQPPMKSLESPSDAKSASVQPCKSPSFPTLVKSAFAKQPSPISNSDHQPPKEQFSAEFKKITISNSTATLSKSMTVSTSGMNSAPVSHPQPSTSVSTKKVDPLFKKPQQTSKSVASKTTSSLKCQFCEAWLSNADSLIAHLKQHAQTGIQKN